ncbi:hypothetical protein H8356DRAFT_1355822 [Neocallimastix lanati (nom. inval.)]|nr:hypothetical protein H8356DRAFT_1355822 [Neocallimastix sp. JGI-2020a]
MLFESVEIIGKENEKLIEHVHVHIIPRNENNWKNNNIIYDEVDKFEPAKLRPLFKQYEDIWNKN